jgi:hypothetical protein
VINGGIGATAVKMRGLPIPPTAGNTGLTLYIHPCILITLLSLVVAIALIFTDVTGRSPPFKVEAP